MRNMEAANEENGTAASARRSRLRWRCRRGMLELDLLLLDFLEHGFHLLPEQGQRDFEALLEAPDPDLLDWLMGRSLPEKKELADVVERIRAHLAA